MVLVSSMSVVVVSFLRRLTAAERRCRQCDAARCWAENIRKSGMALTGLHGVRTEEYPWHGRTPHWFNDMTCPNPNHIVMRIGSCNANAITKSVLHCSSSNIHRSSKEVPGPFKCIIHIVPLRKSAGSHFATMGLLNGAC